ncbi:MAG TPA: FAD-dependent oxidoreductase [Ramlibacter sp.]|nr:FAD-dependent oxidoreductase [Ramlibacter sp.]
MSKSIVVVGGGFAGLWSALAAARLRHELGVDQGALRIVLVEQNAYHNIRVRNYEPQLEECIVRLDDVLGPVGVERVQAEVEGIDPSSHRIRLRRGGALEVLQYDRLVFALGSRLLRPPIAGLAQHAFDVDTYVAATRLREHLSKRMPNGALQAERGVLVVGAGLTGIEVASELASNFREQGLSAPVTICDTSSRIGMALGLQAEAVISTALQELGVHTRTGVAIASIDQEGVVLADGQRVAAGTVVWCAGMRAHPLAATLGVELDGLGRLPVDEFMRVKGLPDVFAAGDAALARVDDEHGSVMSCQHGRPMGRYAGHNVAADLLGAPMLPLTIAWYVTVVDLGAWGAIYTEGWDRQVVAIRNAAKRTKQMINRVRIYPPLTGRAEDIFAAAAPVVQAAPQKEPALVSC